MFASKRASAGWNGGITAYSRNYFEKAMSLQLFLQLMHNRDDINNTEVKGETMASTLAERAGSLLSVSRSFVYRTYKEWRDGQELRLIEAKEKGEKFDGTGWFLQDQRGSYERRFLLNEDDLRIKFRKWIRSNLKKCQLI